jgi:hypothetical protein
MIFLVRVWVPLPQVLEHSGQALHKETSQWMGQGPREQDCSRLRLVGQALPPLKAACFTLRLLICAPVPQDLEQSFHSLQAFMTQSTGQALVLHFRDSVRAPQATPP